MTYKIYLVRLPSGKIYIACSMRRYRSILKGHSKEFNKILQEERNGISKETI